jgi:hypothetical protein
MTLRHHATTRPKLLPRYCEDRLPGPAIASSRCPVILVVSTSSRRDESATNPRRVRDEQRVPRDVRLGEPVGFIERIISSTDPTRLDMYIYTCT